MDSQMKNCPWESIEDFRSLNEFERFGRWMDEQVTTGEAMEVVVARPYIDAPAFREKWYRHAASGEVWRLVWPDGPFTGVFEQVT
jgi:hypothetical protein